MPLVILRTSRFFPEDDDNKNVRAAYSSDNAKLNEFLYRRVDIEDVVSAHQCAMARAAEIGFGKYIISATSPFQRSDVAELRDNAPAVVRRYADFEVVYAPRGWQMFPSIDRVYDNAKARAELGWRPRHDFASTLARVKAGGAVESPLAEAIGVKGYHDAVFDDGPFPDE